MKDTMRSKLTQLVRRLEEIDQNLQDPDVTSNMDQFRALSKERAEIEPVVLKAKEYEQAEEDLAAAEEMLSDEEMKEFASEEIKAAKKAIEQISSELEILLLPKDPNDDKNIYLEIRAGTGGDESALFAGDLFRMYSRYAERQKWQVEFVSASPSDLGGYKEIVVKIVGQGAYSKLKFESGGHRVQRVQETESQGRVLLYRPEGFTHRHVPRLRRRRSAHSENRECCPYYAPSYRHCGRVPRRAEPAQKQRKSHGRFDFTYPCSSSR